VKLLLDKMFSVAVADGLRRVGVDALATQGEPELRGLPDDQLFVFAQLDERCIVTENIADFIAVESQWRAEQQRPHLGLILLAPRAFPRHRRGVVGRLVVAFRAQVETNQPEPGMISWLTGPK
jgi:predicted nuclease of predicted toxin-antitoxin system